MFRRNRKDIMVIKEEIKSLFGVELATPIEVILDREKWVVTIVDYKTDYAFPPLSDDNTIDESLHAIKDVLLEHLGRDFFYIITVGPSLLTPFWKRHLPAPLLKRARFLSRCRVYNVSNIEKIDFLQSIMENDELLT
tara:strand:- start:7513 stop:7923 length:411 start_codon:yes stop_codon:yes gene_type:complete